MPQAEVAMEVREAAPGVRVIDIDGEVTAFSEGVLMDAFAEASGDGVRAVILNFEGLQYMNSGGIGLLVTVLIRANRAGQQLLAYRPQRALPPDSLADPPRRGDRHPSRRGVGSSRRPLSSPTTSPPVSRPAVPRP